MAAMARRPRRESREALLALIQLLDHPDEEVRLGAHVALVRAAGRVLPPERAVWERWLAERPPSPPKT